MPLIVGDLRIGAMDLYRGAVGPLYPPQVAEARDYASAAVNLLLDRQRAKPVEPTPDAPGWAATSSVYQAAGMVMVQIGTDADGAFAALRARAYQEGRSLADIAADVLDRRLRMSDGEV